MAFDFKSVLGEKTLQRMRAHECDVASFRAMTPVEFVDAAIHNLHNNEPIRWQAGDPVYDAVMRYTILPEMIVRLWEQAHAEISDGASYDVPFRADFPKRCPVCKTCDIRDLFRGPCGEAWVTREER